MLLDLNLSGSNGRDVLRLLRSDHRFDSLPVVICTAHDPLTEEDLRNLGAQDFVEKSAVFERLGDVITRALVKPKSGNPVT